MFYKKGKINATFYSQVTFDIEEFLETVMSVDFSNTQLEHLDKIKGEFFGIITDLVEKRVEFDAKRMQSLIKTKISELDDQVKQLLIASNRSRYFSCVNYIIFLNKYEDEPHEKLSLLCIADFLYGSLENQKEVCRTTKFLKYLI